MRFSTIYAISLLAIFTLTRLGLALWTGFDAVPFHDWPALFAKGLWFDLAVLSVAIAPVWLYEALLPNGWRASRLHRVLRIVGFACVAFGLLFVAVAEVTFWLEFSTRFNFIAVDYLLYTQEVIGNIRESYPIGWILAGIALVALVLAFSLRSVFARGDALPVPPDATAWSVPLRQSCLPVMFMAAASIDQMGTIGNSYSDELAGNGIFTFFAAFRRNELDYDRFYATIKQDEADAILKGLGVERRPLSQILSAQKMVEHEDSEEHTSLMPKRPKHIVMITVESLSAEFLGSYGSNEGAHAESGSSCEGGHALRQFLCDRHAHGARSRGRVAGYASRARPIHRAPSRQ